MLDPQPVSWAPTLGDQNPHQPVSHRMVEFHTWLIGFLPPPLATAKLKPSSCSLDKAGVLKCLHTPQKTK